MNKKMKMNSTLSLAGALLMGVAFLSACGGNSKEFNASSAEKAIEKSQALQDSASTVNLLTGYYELNDADARLKLRQLAANEMLTYSAEQINEYIPASYYRPARTREHIFVTVALTEKGKKYVVEQPIKSEYKDLLKNEPSTKTFPESTVAADEQIKLVNPPTAEQNGEVETDGPMDENDVPNVGYESEGSSSASAKASTPYEKAQKRANSNKLNMLAMQLKVYKVLNLRNTEEMMKEGKATCEAILEYDDVTSFGRIIGGITEGNRFRAENLKFNYYNDKGWALEE